MSILLEILLELVVPLFAEFLAELALHPTGADTVDAENGARGSHGDYVFRSRRGSWFN